MEEEFKSILEKLQDILPSWHEHINGFIMEGFTKENRRCFQEILCYVEQTILKPWSDSQDEFVVLTCHENDDFDVVNLLSVLIALAYKKGDTACVEEVQSIAFHYQQHPGAGFGINNLGVMFSANALYEKSEECFDIAKKCFKGEQDHLREAVVTLNLAALHRALGNYQKAQDLCEDAASLCCCISMITTKDDHLPAKLLRRVADLLEEFGNYKLFYKILEIGIRYDIGGGNEAAVVGLTKELMKIQLKEETGDKIQSLEEVGDFISSLFTLLDKPTAELLNAEVIRTVINTARICYNIGHHKEACNLLKKLGNTFLMVHGGKSSFYGSLLYQIGYFLHGSGKFDEAKSVLKQAEEILIYYFGRSHYAVASCKSSLGSCVLLKGNTKEALKHLNEGLVLFRKLNPNHPEVGEILLKLAFLYAEEGKFQYAQEAMQEAESIFLLTCGEESRKTASAYFQLGMILQKVDDFRTLAVDKIKKAIEILLNLGSNLGHPDHPDVKVCLTVLGVLQHSLGMAEEAEKCFIDIQTIAFLRKDSCSMAPKIITPEVANLHFQVSDDSRGACSCSEAQFISLLIDLVRTTTGDDERRKHLETVVSCLEKHKIECKAMVHVKKNSLRASLLYQIGCSRHVHGLGNIDESERPKIVVKQAEGIFAHVFGSSCHAVALCKSLLGFCALLTANNREASKNLNEALTVFKKVNYQHPEVAKVLLKLALLYIEEKNFQGAQEIMKEAMDIFLHVSACRKLSQKTATGHEELKRASAVAKVKQAIDIFIHLGASPNHPDVTVCFHLLDVLQFSQMHDPKDTQVSSESNIGTSKEIGLVRTEGMEAGNCQPSLSNGAHLQLNKWEQLAARPKDTASEQRALVPQESNIEFADFPLLDLEKHTSSSKLQSTLDAEKCLLLPNSSDDGLLSNSACSTTKSSSALTFNSTQNTQAAASNCTSQALSESTNGSPMLTSVNNYSHSAFGSNKISSDSGLNPTSNEKETLLLSRSQAVEESEHDVEVTGACKAGSEERVEKFVDLHVRIQSGANVGNIPWTQQGAFPSAEVAAGGARSSSVFNGTTTDWERLGARPKQGRVQHSVTKQMAGKPFIPVTDGLAGNFLARYTQDKALHDSLYQSVDAEMPLFDDIPSQGSSYINGVINESEQKHTANDDVSATMSEQGTRQEAQKTNSTQGKHSSSTAVSICDPTGTTGLDSTTTSWPSLVCHSSNTTTVGDGISSQGSASGTSIPEPSCGNTDNRRASMLNNGDFGTDSVESTDNSLLALEQRVAEACALVERVLREREEREQFGREIERKEQLIREQRARERREREEREIQEAERWPQQQEAITARSQWLCEHYQRHCRVRFPCCTQYYPCHRCHNISKACDNEEAKACHASHLKCSHCQHEQEVTFISKLLL